MRLLSLATFAVAADAATARFDGSRIQNNARRSPQHKILPTAQSLKVSREHTSKYSRRSVHSLRSQQAEQRPGRGDAKGARKEVQETAHAEQPEGHVLRAETTGKVAPDCPSAVTSDSKGARQGSALPMGGRRNAFAAKGGEGGRQSSTAAVELSLRGGETGQRGNGDDNSSKPRQMFWGVRDKRRPGVARSGSTVQESHLHSGAPSSTKEAVGGSAVPCVPSEQARTMLNLGTSAGLAGSRTWEGDGNSPSACSALPEASPILAKTAPQESTAEPTDAGNGNEERTLHPGQVPLPTISNTDNYIQARAADRGTVSAAAAMCSRLVDMVVPELLRAAKLMAAAGILLRATRWCKAAGDVLRPSERGRSHEGNGGKRKTRRRRADRRAGNDSLRRARESIISRASATRVPVDVIPSLTEAELEVAADLVDCDELDVTFEDIAGMDSVKRSLQEMISEPLDFPPDLYPARLIKPCTGILIYGPPGCGKTLLARAVAKQSGAAFINVKASTLIAKTEQSSAAYGRSAASEGWGVDGGSVGGDRGGGGIGRSSVMVRAVFSLAQKIQPCVVFFDEADGLCLRRMEGEAGANRETMTELMQRWDELASSGRDKVVVLAATNRPWDLDPAVQRRFSRSFQVGLPDRRMRKAVLMKVLEDVDVEEGFDWRELAINTEGYSCGDVVELCREAVREPLREAMERNRRRAARRSRGMHHSRLQVQVKHEQERQPKQQDKRRRGPWQSQTNVADATTSEIAAIEIDACSEAVRLSSVRMRPLRMSDMTAAQRRVVPAFWQAEAYRATYNSYMSSLMEHARQNWSR